MGQGARLAGKNAPTPCENEFILTLKFGAALPIKRAAPAKIEGGPARLL
jgi:hypothetical protein